METQAKLFRSTLTTLLKLLPIFTFPSLAVANPIVQDWQNRGISHEGLLLEPRINFYTTQNNFDSKSQSVALSRSVDRSYFDLNANYSFTDDWYAFARLSVLSTQSTVGLSDQLLGVANTLIQTRKKFKLNVQFDSVIPAYQNPILGDRSIDVTPGLFAEFAVDRRSEWTIETGIGYTYRTRNFSSAIPYRMMVKRSPAHHGLTLAAGIRGQLSLQTDSSTPGSASRTYLSDAVNPAFTLAQAEAGYRNQAGTEVYLLAAAPMLGKNAAAGVQLSLGARFVFGAETRTDSESETQSQKRNLSPVNQLTNTTMKATSAR